MFFLFRLVILLFFVAVATDFSKASLVRSWGSGTIVGESGEILTAAHVVHGCRVVLVILPNGQRVHATIWGIDPVGDLALLRAQLRGGSPPRIREDLAPGETVYVHGFPAAAEGNPIISSSRVSRLKGPLGEGDAISFEGRISAGESGAGVFDVHGNLVGVVYSVTERNWHAIGAARVTEFLLLHGVKVAAGRAVGNPSLSQISHYLRMVSVHILCWQGWDQNQRGGS